MYVQVGDFRVSRGPPTVPLMQILRNTVKKSVSKDFRPKGIWKLHYNITRISPNWPINIWILSQTSNFGPPNMKLHNQIYSKDICLCLIQGISIDPSHVSLVKPLPLTPCNLKMKHNTYFQSKVKNKKKLAEERNSGIFPLTYLKYEYPNQFSFLYEQSTCNF